MILELFENAVLILALCLAHWFVVERWPRGGLFYTLVSGLLFGLAAIVAMLASVTLAPGIIFDARTVVLSVGALVGGAFVALIAGVVAAMYRLWVGGAGALVGIFSILIAAAVGLIFRAACRGRVSTMSLWAFAGLGLAVHLPIIGLFAMLPLDFVGQVLLQLAPPYLIFLILATVGAGLGFRELSKLHHFSELLGESERHYRSLFRSAAIPLLEVDLSRLWKRLEQLREVGVADIRSRLFEHPQLLDELLDSIQVLHANPATLELLLVETEQDIRRNLPHFFGDRARQAFADLVCALWNAEPQFRCSCCLVSAAGTEINVFASVPLPTTAGQARRVPVSLVDTTELQKAQLEVYEQRRRLEEILWGTNVGTWEWNVQTGETRFNERWAQIIGYRLEELEPISINTWRTLAHPDDLAESDQALQRVFNREADFYQCVVRMRHKGGHYVWIQDRGKVVQWDAKGKALRMSGTHTDVTVQKAAEERAERLSAVRQTVLECHGIMLREQQDETRLMQRLAETLVSNRGYALVWVGIPEEEIEKRIVPLVKVGEATAYLDNIYIHWSDDAYSHGPTGVAVKTGKLQVVRDVATDAGFKPWAARAREYGLRSSVASPILIGGKVVAVINIYSDAPDQFGAEELSLINELSSNLSLALQALRFSGQEARLNAELQRAAMGTVGAIAATIEKRDPYTSGHQVNVAEIAVAIARRLKWSHHRVDGLRLGAIVHDIGKIYIPAEILNRPGKLTDNEFGMIKSHPQVGYDILADTVFPWPIREMIVQHHERLDGSGYPNQLSGDEIIEEARILAVADVIDAMTSHRPYRPGLGIDKALAEVERGSGSIYDSQVVEAALRLIRDEGFRWGREHAAMN